MTRHTPTAVEELRLSTGSLHAQLDAGLPIGQANAVLADYVSHLQTLRPWLVQSEAMFRATKTRGLGPAADRVAERLAKIDADLADATEPSLAAASVKSPAHGAFTDPVAAAYAWGRAYVVEGSGLGGRVLFKRLQARLSPHPLRYLAGDAGDAAISSGKGWKDFNAELELHLSTPMQRLEAQRGAVAAFSELLDSFGLGAHKSLG